MPFLVDYQRISFALDKRRTHFLARLQAALDAAWIEEERESLVVQVPQLFIQFQKRQIDFLARGFDQMHVLISLASAHRSGKMDIKLELILRQLVCAGVNLLYDRVRRRLNLGNREFSNELLLGTAELRQLGGQKRLASARPAGTENEAQSATLFSPPCRSRALRVGCAVRSRA